MIKVQELLDATLDLRKSPDSMLLYTNGIPVVDYKLTNINGELLLELIEGDYLEEHVNLAELLSYVEGEELMELSTHLRHVRNFDLIQDRIELT